MVNLSGNDRQALITLLTSITELGTQRGRMRILENVGLAQLEPMIDLSGAPYLAVSEMVSYLERYGRITYDNEALGVLLNGVKPLVGLEQQRFLDALLQRYSMMTPVANAPQPTAWHGRETDESLLEKVFGENTLRPIAFLAQGLQVARSVAYIGVRDGAAMWSGTGFLISRDLLVTNNHVLSSADLLPDTVVRFNYEEDFDGSAQVVSEFRSKNDGIFHTDKALDVTIVQLNDNPGERWGWIPPHVGRVARGDRVNIIQHPGGLPKQVAMQNNFVEYADADIVQYITATQRGSSGSPVFDDAWRLVGLHHAGGYMQEPGSSRRYFRNEGIRFGRILAALPAELQDHLLATA